MCIRDRLSDITGITPLYPDIGLHGGGWHMSGDGGSLAVHLDYSIHPKLNLQRKLNLIIYLEEDYDSDWGGSLQFWSHDDKNKKPLNLIRRLNLFLIGLFCLIQHNILGMGFQNL